MFLLNRLDSQDPHILSDTTLYGALLACFGLLYSAILYAQLKLVVSTKDIRAGLCKRCHHMMTTEPQCLTRLSNDAALHDTQDLMAHY